MHTCTVLLVIFQVTSNLNLFQTFSGIFSGCNHAFWLSGPSNFTYQFTKRLHPCTHRGTFFLQAPWPSRSAGSKHATYRGFSGQGGLQFWRSQSQKSWSPLITPIFAALFSVPRDCSRGGPPIPPPSILHCTDQFPLIVILLSILTAVLVKTLNIYVLGTVPHDDPNKAYKVPYVFLIRITHKTWLIDYWLITAFNSRPCAAGLVLRWLTVCVRVNHLGM